MTTRCTTLMTDNTALANALTALMTAVAALCLVAVNPKVYNPFTSNDPLDLSSRSDSLAYDKISLLLDKKMGR